MLVVLAVLIFPVMIFGLGAYGLAYVEWPAVVVAELTVTRLQLQAGGDRRASVLAPLRFQELSISGFRKVRVQPDQLFAADPARYDPETGQYPKDAWSKLEVTGEVDFAAGAAELHPSIAIEPWANSPGAAGGMPAARVEPGTWVTLEIDAEGTLVVLLEEPDTEMDVRVEGSIQLFTRECSIESKIQMPFAAPPIAYRMALAEHSPALSVFGGASATSLSIVLDPDEGGDLLPPGNIPVQQVRLLRAVEEERFVSYVAGEGTVQYRDYPKIAEVEVSDSDLLVFEDPRDFWITALEVKGGDSEPALRLQLQGEVRQVRVAAAEPWQVFQVSAFDALRGQPVLASVFGIVIWAFSTTLVGYRLYKEVKADTEKGTEP